MSRSLSKQLFPTNPWFRCCQHDKTTLIPLVIPKSNKHLTSPYNITHLLQIEEMRIKGMITK